jgi:hypothetical protein
LIVLQSITPQNRAHRRAAQSNQRRADRRKWRVEKRKRTTTAHEAAHDLV